MKIYSIGYEELPRDTVLRWLDWVSPTAVLVDVRSQVVGFRVKRGFRRDELSAALGPRYEWRGDVLGGRGSGPTTEGLAAVAGESRDIVLMCQERSPAGCHRHIMIAEALPNIDVQHIYPVEDGDAEAEIISAKELTLAIDEDRDYAFTPAFL